MLACYSLIPWVNEDLPPMLLDACTPYVDTRCQRIAEERGYQMTWSDAAPWNRNLDKVDILALPYKDGQFRGVVSCDTVEHVQDMDAALRELHRVTMEGGFLVLCLPVCFLGDGKKRQTTEPCPVGHPMHDHHKWNPGMDMEPRILAAGYSLVARLECARWDKMKTSVIWLLERLA